MTATMDPTTKRLNRRRFPYEPLARLGAAAIGLPYCEGRRNCTGCGQGDHAGPAAIARWLGVSDSATLRWIGPGIPERTADRVCAHVGLHPNEVPGWDWYGDIDVTFDDDWIAQGDLLAMIPEAVGGV